MPPALLVITFLTAIATPEIIMPPHVLPEYGYIVGFLACIIGVFIVAHVVAAIAGYREK